MASASDEWHVPSGGNSRRAAIKWKAFLAHKRNKTQLLELLLQIWQTPQYAPLLKNKLFFVASGNNYFRLSSADGVVVTCLTVPELRSNQEEADTRLLLHAHHAATHHVLAIIVRSPDTDVAVFCCHFQRSIPKPMYFRTGMRQRMLAMWTYQL